MNKKKAKYSLAVGLNYQDGDDEAPTVSCKGERLVADDIVRIARRYGVSVVENPEVAEVLSQLEIEEQIPEDLFQPVAYILNKLSKA